MENAEEILQCLDEFSKVKPKDIPRELEDYLCFVAKTEFYETCPSVEIPPCPNVDSFNYDSMKSFILEKLDTFAAAPFTVQRICELLTTPRKEYNRIDKYMRALEKNILVVSTREPGNRRNTENGESVVNGLESEHVAQDIINSDINVEVEMDDSSVWPKTTYVQESPSLTDESQPKVQDTFISESKTETAACSSTIETVITSRPLTYMGYPPATDPSQPTDPGQIIPSPAEPITVTISNEEEIEQEEEPQPEAEPPIYVSSLSHKDTSIYLGTNENGDQVYRIKYEPYVEIDYMAIPETAFPAEQETVYENPEDTPATETPATEPVQVPVVESEPEPQPQPEPTPEPEPVISEPIEAMAEPVSEPISEPAPEPVCEPASEPESTTPVEETTISSSDEVQPPSEPVSVLPSEPEPKTTSEDQVTESSIISDCSISQTTVSEPLEAPTSEVKEDSGSQTVESSGTVEELAQVELPADEAMDVDEPVSESQPQTQEPDVSQTDSTEEASVN